MNHLLGPFIAIASFLYAPAVLLGWSGGYVGYVLVPLGLVILTALSVQGLKQRDANARPRLWIPVALIPAIWIFIVIWGFAMAVEPGSQFQHSSWVGDVITAAAAFSLIASIFFIIYQRGSRLFITCYSFINIWLTVSACFIAAMQVTGIWI